MAVDLVASDEVVLANLANRDAVHDGRSSVGDLLLRVAEDARFATRRPELGALVEAVKAGGGREAVWRGIELEQTFTPETTIRLAPRKRRRAAGAIGAAAAIVVFLPVAWTWWSFQDATNAYQRLLTAGKASGESFLQLWTTGFLGELSPMHWLPSVALWSTMLIGLCVFLIVGERLMSRSADRADDDEYQECAALLASALNFAQITINSRNLQERVQGLDVIQEAVEQLLIAHQQTREASEILRNSAQDLEKSMDHIAASLQTSTTALLSSFELGLDGLVNSLVTAMNGAASTLLGSVDGVAQTLERSVAHSSGTLESSITSAVGSLDTSVGQIALASTGMSQAVTASAGAQQVLAQAAAGLAANTQSLEAGLREQIKIAADAISHEVEQLRAEASSIAQSTGHVGTSLGQHTSALQHQITELTQIRASLERVSGLGAGAGTGALAGTAGR